MSRAGRKRKIAPRVGGRLQRSNTQHREDIQAVVKAQRITHHGATPETAGDARYETALGRLYMDRQTDSQWLRRYEAGRTYHSQHRRYLSICDAPSSATCTLGKVLVDGDPSWDQGNDDADISSVRRFVEAYRALKDCGSDVYRAVTCLVVSDVPVSASSVKLVENGLDALVAHYRLDAREKAA